MIELVDVKKSYHRGHGEVQALRGVNLTVKDGEFVFKQSTSMLFKSMQVARFHDKKRDVLVYLVYSDKLIDGSPKNSVSAVPILRNRAQ